MKVIVLYTSFLSILIGYTILSWEKVFQRIPAQVPVNYEEYKSLLKVKLNALYQLSLFAEKKLKEFDAALDWNMRESKDVKEDPFLKNAYLDRSILRSKMESEIIEVQK